MWSLFRVRPSAADTGPRPPLAAEIWPDGVLAAASEGAGASPRMAWAPLPAGAVTPGFRSPNLAAPDAVSAALGRALGEISGRQRQMTLVLPDACVRVLLLDFDALPARAEEARAVVRFRLKKMLPFDAEQARVSYQVMAEQPGQLRTMVAAAPGPVLDEYEAAVREAGYEPGAVIPSALATAAALAAAGPELLVSLNARSLSTLIVRAGELLLYRSVELPALDQLVPGEIARSVAVSIAYYEDTVGSAPARLLYSGPGGADDFRSLAGENVTVRDTIARTGAAYARIPAGFAPAGVVGALLD